MRQAALALAVVGLVAGCGASHTGSVAAVTTGPVVPRSTSATSATSSPATPPPASTTAPAPATSHTTATPRHVPSHAVTTPRPARRSTPAAPALPAFHATAAGVTAAELGATYHAGCPTAPSGLRALTLSFVDFAGHAETGTIIVAADQAGRVEHLFATLYAARFPIRRMVPVSAYGGSDDRSVAADNTAGFNCRAAVTAGGTSSWSMHAYGDAIDVDPVENPYVYGGTVDPPAGAAYRDRADHRPGMTYAGSTVNAAFAGIGWAWGARFDDYQHFSTNGK